MIRFLILDYHEASIDARVATIVVDLGQGAGWAPLEGSTVVWQPAIIDQLADPLKRMADAGVAVRTLSIPQIEPVDAPDGESYWARARPVT